MDRYCRYLRLFSSITSNASKKSVKPFHIYLYILLVLYYLKDNEMQSINLQDQSTQAMTEVALALSMAFFSLLLVALLSIGVPESTEKVTHETSAMLPEFLLTESSSTIQSAEDTKQPTDIQYVFYFKGKLYDQYLQETQINNLNNKQKLVVAMSMDTEVTQALTLQKRFKNFDLALSIMDSAWLLAFESKINAKTQYIRD
jgi:fucose 4-O-acetylase-like acetyltransferase